MKKLLNLLAVLATTTTLAQTAGDYKVFRKGAGIGDSTRYVAKVNNSLWSLNTNGMLTFMAQSNFANASHTHAFADLTAKPTTISGYGITDFNSLGDARWSLLGHTHAASDITSGVFTTARLGTGTANSSTYLRGDGTWQTVATGGGTWGSITGTLSDQTDLVAALSSVQEPTAIIDVGSTNTTVDPGQNTMRFNSGTASSVTEISLSDVTAGSVDKGNLNSLFGGILQGRTVGTSTTFEYRITAAVHTSFTRYTVTYLKGSIPADNTVIAVRYIPEPSTGGSGTVTSVAVSGSDGIEVDSGSPVTSSGTIALGVEASALKTHLSLGNVENTALSTWTGSANITTLGTIGTGVWNGDRIDFNHGGTGQNSYTLGDLLYSDATNSLAKLAGNTTTKRNFLSQTGNGSVSAAPAWRQITTSDVSGLGTLATQSGTFSGTHSGTSSGTNTGDQTISITGDATASGSAGTLTATVTKINGTSLAGLATGILKNTTSTGVPSIAVAGDFPTLNQNTTGSAATLTTARNINGTAFNGSADITVTAAAGTLTGTTLNSGVTGSSLTSVGTITSGVWNGTDVAVADGGTGSSTASGARTNLGATTVGGNLFTLTNPSASTYARINADNTVTTRTMPQSRTDLALHPVTITAITGGSQSTTSTSLADVTGSTINFPDTGWYEWEYFIIHSSGATSTGAFYAVNTGGTMVQNFMTYCISYDVLSTDKDTYCVDGFNSVIASTSSRATANNRCRMQGTIHVTTAGGMVLRFATEVNASAITITDLSGWYRNL